MRSRAIISVSLMSIFVSYGCQYYPSNLIREEQLDKTDLKNQSYLKFDMDIGNLNGCGQRYQVQSLAYTSIEFSVMGPGLAMPLTASYTPQDFDCLNNQLSHTFGRVPSGVPLTLTATVKNGSAVVAYASRTETLSVNTSTNWPLTCSVDTAANVSIDFSCEELCDPPPPFNTSSLGGNAMGMVVDNAENVYLFTYDPQVNPYTYGSNDGRVIKVSSSLPATGTLFYDNVMKPWQGVYADGSIFVADVSVKKLDLSGNLVSNTSVTGGIRTISTDNNGGYWTSMPGGCGFNIASFPGMSNFWVNNPTTGCQVQGGPDGTTWSVRSMVFDANNRPIWSCTAGLLTPGTTPSSNLITLAPKPTTTGTNSFWGIANTNDTSKFVVDIVGDPNVYIWSQSQPGNFTTIAHTFANEYPRHIVRSESGKYFILTAKDSALQSDVSMPQFSVYRAELVNSTFTKVRKIITNY